MTQNYRLVIQYQQTNGQYDEGETLYAGVTHHPSTLTQLGLRHLEQIEIIRALQEAILKQQSVDLQEAISFCPKCGHEVIRHGVTHSSFSAVFTDHKVGVHRLKCKQCEWTSVPSIKSLFGSHLHPDLVKLQCEHGSRSSYTESQNTLNKLSGQKRSVNNTMSVRHVVETVGNYASSNPITIFSFKSTEQASELIVQVDGGHVKSKEEKQRSFEALTAVIYKPEAVIPGKKKRNTGTIKQKHCAASALDDEGKQIKALTLVAAKKEGLSAKTKVTALCDGADNCWNVIDSISPYCANIERILDWFHIAKKFQNTRMGEKYNLHLAKAKWSLWHGDAKSAIEKLTILKNKLRNRTNRKKLEELIHYLTHNQEKLVNYEKRYHQGKVVSSQMAESTVESLINQRCKGKRHMQWSREGLHPVLQLRALIASNDWDTNWEKYVMGAFPSAA
jgi:hypothetical protein